MTFITSTGYDVAAIMRDAHRRAKKLVAKEPLSGMFYADAFKLYLGQVWITAQHERRAANCTGATVTVERAFDNGGSPLWSMKNA